MMNYQQQSIITLWMDKLPTLEDLKRQHVSEDEILEKALNGEAELERDEVRELHYKCARNGQFFTPHSVADLVAFLGDIQPNETVLDPACGLGNLMEAASIFSDKVDGIELMHQTARLASKVMDFNVKQGNSLEMLSEIESYDVLLMNPPFGRVKEHAVNNWDSFSLNKGKKSNRLEVLFLELCLKIAKRRVVMIAPNSLLSCQRDRFVRKWLLENFGYRATISLPQKTFWETTRTRNKWRTPATTTSTSIMVIDKVKPEGDYKVFMAIAQNVDELVYVEQLWSSFAKTAKTLRVPI